MDLAKKLTDWLADPEGGHKSVVDLFFIIGISVLFTGFWIAVYRRAFHTKLLG